MYGTGKAGAARTIGVGPSNPALRAVATVADVRVATRADIGTVGDLEGMS